MSKHCSLSKLKQILKFFTLFLNYLQQQFYFKKKFVLIFPINSFSQIFKQKFQQYKVYLLLKILKSQVLMKSKYFNIGFYIFFFLFFSVVLMADVYIMTECPPNSSSMMKEACDFQNPIRLNPSIAVSKLQLICNSLSDKATKYAMRIEFIIQILQSRPRPQSPLIWNKVLNIAAVNHTIEIISNNQCSVLDLTVVSLLVGPNTMELLIESTKVVSSAEYLVLYCLISEEDDLFKSANNVYNPTLMYGAFYIQSGHPKYGIFSMFMYSSPVATKNTNTCLIQMKINPTVTNPLSSASDDLHDTLSLLGIIFIMVLLL